MPKITGVQVSEPLLSLLLCIFLGVEFLGHVEILYWTFWERTHFSIVAVTFSIPASSCTRIPISLHPCQHLCSVFWIIAILTGVRWYLTVALIYTSLKITDVDSAIPIKIPKSFITEIEKQLWIQMEPQKATNCHINSEKEQSWNHHTFWLQNILQSYSNQSSMILA